MIILFSNSSSTILEHAFLVPNLSIFIFALNFTTRQIQGPWFQMTIFFSNSSPKIPKEGIFGLKFKHFYFFMKFCNFARVLISNVTIVFLKFQSNKTNSRISNMAIVFSNYSPKIPKLGIFVPRFKDFYFAANFAIKQVRGS